MTRRRGPGWIAVAVLATLAGAAAATGPATSTPANAAPEPAGRTTTGDRGTWLVEALDEGRYRVSWTSPTDLPLTSDRPTVVAPEGSVVGPPTVGTDNRTVRAVVSADARPSGADLDIVLSGDRLDAVGDDAASVTGTVSGALALPGTETLPSDPGALGPYAVQSRDYQLEPVKLPGMRVPIEMVGHVVEPADDAATGPRPLVLFLHGRHSVCYDPGDPGGGGEWPCRAPEEDIPSHLGYVYIQRLLASQGFATVSVRVNGINAQDWRLSDGGADARADIVEHHLDHWAGIAAAHQIDLDRVVLVGHSRGGEGVDRASIQIPLSAPYRVVGQVLIAPTDFGTQTAPYVPTVTLLPSCDGDVSDLQGQRFTDTVRDLTTDDTSLKSSVLVMGANHNFFNTEWTPGIAKAPSWDDWGGPRLAECGRGNPDRLTGAEQRAVGRAYVAGAVRLFALGEQDLLPMFDGTRARVASQGDAETLSHAIGGGRDIRRPSIGASLAATHGATTRFCGGSNASLRVGSCARGLDDGGGWVRPHWPAWYEVGVPTRRFFEMTWTAAGQSGGLLLSRPLDLSARRLELRTIVDPSYGDADLRVRLVDSSGASALVTPEGGGAVPAIGGSPELWKYWAQSVVVDPAAADGLDLTRIVQVDLVTGTSQGRLWVADLGAAPESLPEVADRRLPTLDLGATLVPEGDGDDPAGLALPFRVTGDVSRPASFAVVTTGEDWGSRQRFTVDLAPGQTSGAIPLQYVADRLDDPDRTTFEAAVWPKRNLMTDSYLGSATVVDDDPTPDLETRAADRVVSEGDVATWVVRWAAPVDYESGVDAVVVAGPRPRVRVADVSRTWVERHVGDADADLPLWRAKASVFGRLGRGTEPLKLRIPIRRDGVREPRESITLRIHVGDRPAVVRTIWVR